MQRLLEQNTLKRQLCQMKVGITREVSHVYLITMDGSSVSNTAVHVAALMCIFHRIAIIFLEKNPKVFCISRQVTGS